MYVYQIVRIDETVTRDRTPSRIYTTPEAAIEDLESMGFEVDPYWWQNDDPTGWTTDEKKNWPCTGQIKMYDTYTHFHIYRTEVEE